MQHTNPDIDAYIEQAPPFARPILITIRRLIHKACPEVTETIKWGMPHFEHHGILAQMAAFKHHATFGFWKGKLMSDPHGLFRDELENRLHWRRIESLEDLPSEKILLAYIREAVRLNEEGIKLPPPERAKKPKLVIPPDLRAALKTNPAARETFDNFSYSHQREYVEWITEAKQAATRERRIATAIEWLAEGKPRNWKYRK